jgi:Transposase zinc-ribbon domain
VQYPGNWDELMAWFPDDGARLRYLERLRWGEGFTCRFCGTVGGGWWQMSDGLRRVSGGDVGGGRHDLRWHAHIPGERQTRIGVAKWIASSLQ